MCAFTEIIVMVLRNFTPCFLFANGKSSKLWQDDEMNKYMQVFHLTGICQLFWVGFVCLLLLFWGGGSTFYN